MDNNIKARAFAAYLGSPKVNQGKEVGVVVAATLMNVHHKGLKLLLKPLSSITDEDAIDFHRRFETGIKSDIVNSMREYLPLWLEEGGLDIAEVDYLRSKGYLLPFMGKDLLKENIALLKTEK